MFFYRVPAPDEAMLISGGKVRGESNAPFRVVTGRGAFVMPFFRKVRFLSLHMAEAEITETCVTKQAITLKVRAVILSDQRQMEDLTGRIFSGHLRSIVGAMTVEEIITERQKLALEVLDASATEMARIGLTIDSLQIQSIDDLDLGYISALSAPHNAAVQREAQIAQARANQAAAEAEQESKRKQAEYSRQTSIVQAQYKAEIDRAQAEAAQSGPLAQATATQEVINARTELAQREASLREQQLVAEVVKPAQAEAERVRIIAKAEAEATEIQAAAAASYDRVALDRLIIEQLPQIVEKAAGGLKGANVNILSGADGLGEMAAGLVGQGLAILDSVKKGLNGDQQDKAQQQDRRELNP
jgi:flotillin